MKTLYERYVFALVSPLVLSIPIGASEVKSSVTSLGGGPQGGEGEGGGLRYPRAPVLAARAEKNRRF